jgi:hypothetical protein
MELRLPPVKAFALKPALAPDVAQQQAVDKRASIVAGGLSGLFSRPKPEEVDLTFAESRYEAFWHAVCSVRYVFERNKSFSVPVTAPEVRKVTVLGQEFEVAAPPAPLPQQSSPTAFLQQIGQQIGLSNTGPRTFSLPGVEYCVDENRQERFLEAVAGQALAAGADYVRKESVELTSLEELASGGALIVAPQLSAARIVRTLLGTMVKQIQADNILEEVTAIEALNLYFRPVYAFEFAWRPKNKSAAVEFDGLTGAMVNGKVVRTGGSLSPEALFDITPDNAASLFPSFVGNVQVATA